MSKTLIEVNNLTKHMGGKTLFEDISFAVYHGEKAGLTGLNGCGKSTLLKIIAGVKNPDTTEEYDSDLLSVDSGNVRRIPRSIKIGYLPQWIDFSEETTGQVIDNSLNNTGIDEEWRREILREDALEKTGLTGIDPQHLTSLLSGGEKTRLFMAKLLIMEPDFFLLDEPTNFLDIKGLQWMENFIRNLKQGVLMVSHDRYFLDRVVHRIIELDSGSLYEYSGNYSFYRRAKAERIERQWKDHRRYKEEVRRLHFQMQRIKQFAENKENSTVNDFARARAKVFAKKAKSMETRIEKIQEVEKPERNYMANICFNGSSGSRIVAGVEDLSKSFGDRLLYSKVSFGILAGEKVGILGENGCGKTTLLRILQGKDQADSGTVSMLDEKRVGYFSQVFEVMDETCRIVDLVMEYTGFNLPEARQLLAHFLFFREDVFKEIGKLSVGERSRVAMACIKGKEPEVLILDEPTCHLDVDTTEILEKALLDYGGTIIIVTHDRLLLNNLVEKLLVIENETITCYPGNFTYYLEKNRELEENAFDGVSKPLCSRETRLLLECRIAQIAGKLRDNNMTEEERADIQEEFMRLKKELNLY